MNAPRELLVAGGLDQDSSPRPSDRPAASPLRLALVIPLLVLLTGIGIGGTSWWTARSTAAGRAEETLLLLGGNAVATTQGLFASGGELLSALRDELAARPEQGGDLATARRILSLMRGRTGIAQCHIARRDGSWCGIASEDGGYRLLHLVRGGDGQLHQAAQRLDREGQPLGEEEILPQPFDPRTRPFWRSAAAAGRRIWTEPYLFARTGRPGITLAEPVADAAGTQATVLAVDFDLDSLGRAFRAQAGGRSRTLLFAADRTLLVLPMEWRGRPGQLPNAGELDDPLGRALFAALDAAPAPAPGRPPGLVRFRSGDGSEWGAAVAAVALADGPTWYVGELAGAETLYGDSGTVLRHGLLAGALTLLLGVAAGLWFALHLARQRREVSRQRQRARTAEAQVRALGSYQLVKPLGAGGMGEVWLARHRLLARPAAVKLILPGALGGSEAQRREVLARFDREARITAGLRSRSTIELFDYGVTRDGTFFYVMELLDGLDLRDLVVRYGPMPLGRVRHLLLQACGSLAEAHEHGLVHRDIKPDNLHACRRADEVDVLKVLDFGLVTERPDQVRPGISSQDVIHGTPGFMSPEQAQGGPLDGRSDLYSLGCVAFFLVSGREVFEAGNPFELLEKHVRLMPSLVSQAAGRPLPVEFDRLVSELLAKDPAARPASARDLARRLALIPVPSDQVWDESRARAWWRDHLPPAASLEPAKDASDPARAPTVLMP